MSLLPRPRPHARYLAPEVVQTSVMDCGPATLQSLVQGFGLAVNYGRLREACQTGVDGTSISMMDEIANLLGLDTEEMMLPVDHLFLAEANVLPAIVVVRNPDGSTHFVVVWSVAGPWVQVMDPAQGRTWMLRQAFLNKLYVHITEVPAAAWRAWAAEDEFQSALDTRLAALDIAAADRARLRAAALADPTWTALGALDCATRMTQAMVDTGALETGAPSLSLIERQIEPVDGKYPLLLNEYRSVWRTVVQDSDEETLDLRGVVLVRARGRRADKEAASPPEARQANEAGGDDDEAADADADDAPRAALPPELIAALSEDTVRPGRTLIGMLREDGLLTPAVLAMVIAVSAALVTVNALLLRGLLEVGGQLGLPGQRAGALAAVLGFLVLGLLVELPLIGAALRMGRTLDVRLRLAFLRKIPRLDDRYFRSRLLSDMAERGHTLHTVRALPWLGVRVLSSAAQLVFTVGGIAWLSPASTPLALVTVVVAIGLPILCQPMMAERELRVRSHASALGRFYLDVLLGLLPIRVHGARPAMQRQQESLLVQWMAASLKLQGASTVVEGVLALCGLAMAVLMVWSVASHTTSGLLLLVYWALALPALGQDIALVARQYPSLRNTVLRLLEPLGTPEPIEPPAADAPRAVVPDARGVAIEMTGVSVEAGGHTVLADVNLTIAPGEHVAVVGPSGAGKSSLVGLLLGWYRAGRGTVAIDGRPLVGQALYDLRRDTAWVDPAITLWNRSFLDNLRYGADGDRELPLADILHKARLREVLEHLPDGLATELGEGGGMVSGGEGQRTRVGRALAKPRARLVILDEPFRGLDLATRRELMAMVRAWWPAATMLWVTHDILETEGFARVLVVDGGQIVEDAAPAALAASPASRYATLLRGDRELRAAEWAGNKWRKVWLANGQLREERPARDEEPA
ncbi:MAG TPA: ATP-binding cassette domain-containing protein [Kofleriaceae bacterium]|nr:ATP-binding cassette domain-containing protein [Kofleriaceae bacterium]